MKARHIRKGTIAKPTKGSTPDDANPCQRQSNGKKAKNQPANQTGIIDRMIELAIGLLGETRSPCLLLAGCERPSALDGFAKVGLSDEAHLVLG